MDKTEELENILNCNFRINGLFCFYLVEVQTRSTLLTWVQRSCTMHVIFFILVPSAMFVLIDLKTNKNVDEPTIDGFP